MADAPDGTSHKRLRCIRRGNGEVHEAWAPEAVLPNVLATTQPTAEILPWHGRGNVIAAAGTMLLALLEWALMSIGIPEG